MESKVRKIDDVRQRRCEGCVRDTGQLVADRAEGLSSECA